MRKSAKEQAMDWQPSGLQEQPMDWQPSGLQEQEQAMDWQPSQLEDSDPRSSYDQRDSKKSLQQHSDQQGVGHMQRDPRPGFCASGRPWQLCTDDSYSYTPDVTQRDPRPGFCASERPWQLCTDDSYSYTPDVTNDEFEQDISKQDVDMENTSIRTHLKLQMNSSKEPCNEPQLNPDILQIVTRRGRDLIRNNEPLDDIAINETQSVLRKQFRNTTRAFQNVLLIFTSFLAVVGDPIIQILHTGHFHWVCSSSIGGLVRVFDSSPQKNLTGSMKRQLAQCYQPLVRDQKLFVHLPALQIQEGPVECGLFAVAFAVDLAHGNDPSTIIYDEGQMRQHLYTCLEMQSFTPFPRQTKPTRFSDDFSQTIDLG